MKQPDSASITRRGFLGVRLGQDITPCILKVLEISSVPNLA
jgi:hypothetical protein